MTFISWDCPFFDNSLFKDAADENLFMDILSAIQPGDRIRNLVNLAKERMKLISGKNGYNFLRHNVNSTI